MAGEVQYQRINLDVDVRFKSDGTLIPQRVTYKARQYPVSRIIGQRAFHPLRSAMQRALRVYSDHSRAGEEAVLRIQYQHLVFNQTVLQSPAPVEIRRKA